MLDSDIGELKEYKNKMIWPLFGAAYAASN